MAFERLDRGLKWYERIGPIGASTLILIAAGVGLAKFGWSHQVHVWFLILIVAFLLIVAIAGCAFFYGLGRRNAPSAGAAPETANVAELEAAVASSEYAKRLIRDILESIQQSIAREDDWELDDLVERGVLGPVRGLLVREDDEDVRLAVLTPFENEPDRWYMRWAAGHRPESVRSYARDIDETMAGIAYRRGTVIQCGDVRKDDRFQPNPRETRPFTSLVAIPLQTGENIVGALSVVSTRTNAFGPRELSFIQVVGGVLDVLLADEHDLGRIARELDEAVERARAGTQEGVAPHHRAGERGEDLNPDRPGTRMGVSGSEVSASAVTVDPVRSTDSHGEGETPA